MPTGIRIKEIRKQKGLTQKQLGDICGIADANIRKYENGKQNPKIETLKKIADALEVPLYELLHSDELAATIDKTPAYSVDLTGYSADEIDKVLKLLKKDTNTDIMQNDMEGFLCFLEWLGYKLTVSDYEEMQTMKITPQSDDDYLISIQDKNHGNVTFFHKKDFVIFQNEIAKAVDYEIYKHFNDPTYKV